MVNNVSFTGLKQTKNGNIYQKKNTGKRIGTAVGLIGGYALSQHPSVQFKAIEKSAELALTKLPLHSSVLLGAGVLAITLLCRGLGSIPDFFINRHRKAQADKKAENI
ncbi:MAG: hypothetical protein NC191_01960 [Muribaculaceae bacterium]|nr:hypothetical protein [Muribaculaceae bacterium]